MYPTRLQAEALLAEALPHNPSPWGRHSRTAAHCAECLARASGQLDPEKAYVLGLLHDIGRRFGKRHLGHVSDGYTYLMQLGYDEAARICLTHSFVTHSLAEYIGSFDTTPTETALIERELAALEFDAYDRLIQLCDALAGADGVLDVEARMLDVKHRYGSYPQAKWDATLALKAQFEALCGGRSVYELVDQAHFRPQD